MDKILRVVNDINPYTLLIDKIKIDVELAPIISRLRKLNFDNFKFNQTDNLWYYYNYKSNSKLIDILIPNRKILHIKFINNDYNDYRFINLELTFDNRYDNSFTLPNEYEIVLEGTSTYIREGKCAKQYRNMYWKVKESNENIFYIMHIKDNLYTKISECDINKVLNFNDDRPTWRLFENGYIACTISLSSSSNQESTQKVYYLHQLIMNVHNEDLTNYEKTVDHINNDKLDNRRENLRLVDMSIQNSNRPKSERRCDACELPTGIKQSDLPKYVIYGKEIMNSETGKYREYFYISNHPKLEKSWTTSKSEKITIYDKLELAKLKIQELEGHIIEKEKELDLPNNIKLINNRDKQHFVFDLKTENIRYNCKSILKSTNIQIELDNFIDSINKKYSELKMERYKINNIVTVNETEIGVMVRNDDIPKIDLPPNFILCKDKDSYCLQYIKYINKEKLNKKLKIRSNNIQQEFNNLILLLEDKYPNYKNEFPKDYLISTQNVLFITESVLKPIMPCNFSICNVNSIDHIQFSKLIDGKKYQFKTKIASYNLQNELDKFANYINETKNINIGTNHQIVQLNNWKTSNKIK